MRRVCVVLAAVLATFAPVVLPAASACMIGGSFWHLPAASQGGGYLALSGAIVSLLRADTQEILEQRLTGVEGRWSFDVDVSTDFVVTVSGYATLAGPTGGVYFFGDPPHGLGNGTVATRCTQGSVQFGALHVLEGTPAPPALLRRNPRVSVRPWRARSGARVHLKARHFDSGERLLVVEERPNQTVRASTLDTNPAGIARLTITGRQPLGRHRICLRGETSHREACATYRVRAR